jgi:hypothetical protein
MTRYDLPSAYPWRNWIEHKEAETLLRVVKWVIKEQFAVF